MAKNGYFVLILDDDKQLLGKKRGCIFKIFKQHLSLTWKKNLAYKKRVHTLFYKQLI